MLKEKEKTVKAEVFNSKDQRGLTPLHKVCKAAAQDNTTLDASIQAVGLNKKEVAEFLLSKVS